MCVRVRPPRPWPARAHTKTTPREEQVEKSRDIETELKVVEGVTNNPVFKAAKHGIVTHYR